MENKIKWVEVEYKDRNVDKIPHFGMQLDSFSKTLELAEKVFEDAVTDQIAIVCLDTKMKITNVLLTENYFFFKNQKENIAKVILNNANAIAVISNNDYLVPQVYDVTAMLQYIGIKPVDFVVNDGDEYLSFANRELNFINNYNNLELNDEYEFNYNEIKKDSALKLKTIKQKKATDNILTEASNDIVERLSKSDREKMVIMSLDDDLNYINSSVVSVGNLNGSIVHPREILKVPLLSGAKNFIAFHNHSSGNNIPSKEDLDVTYGLQKCASMLGINFIDHGIIGAFNDDILYIKEQELMTGDREKDILKLEKLRESYAIKERNIVNIKVSKPYVLEGNANNGAEVKIVMIPDGITIEGTDIGNYTFEPRTINQSKENSNVCDIPYQKDERIKLKKGEEIIYITAGALAEASLTKDYTKNFNYKTEYIDYENKTWNEYIECFVTNNIEVLAGDNISKEYFAEEFLNSVEIPQSDTMKFLNHFEPAVFDYLQNNKDLSDNFDELKLNLIKSGIKEFTQLNLAAENGFIKVNENLVSNIKEKFLSNSEQKTNSMEMEL